MSRLLQVCFWAVLAGAVLAGAVLLDAADGSIVVNQVLLRVDAIAGGEDCTFLGPVEGSIIVACFAAKGDAVVIRQLHDVKPVLGGDVITGDFSEDGNKISWSLSETAGGVFHWEIHSNDTVRSGDFAPVTNP